jgi:WD40 repeat protein
MPERVDRFNLSDVFISYSRRDGDFVKRLGASFKSCNKEVWVDYEDIAPSVDWWEEIKAGIEGSGTFVFVISPDSIASEVCRQEINAALENGKRFIPLLYRDINLHETKENIHPAISSHNWLYFRELDDYEGSFHKLINTIDTDFDYLRQHTRILVRAREWEARGWDKSALLTGSELDEAWDWLKKASQAKPNPTELHARYINTSAVNRSRQRWLWAIGTLVTAVFAILSITLFFALQDSTRNAKDAEDARIAAEESRDDAENARLVAEESANEASALAVSASLVSSAQIAFEDGDSFSALAFALAANRVRPLPIAQMTLSDIAYQPGAIQWLNTHLSYIEQVDIYGNLAVSASRDDSLVIWNIETGELLHTLNGHNADVKTAQFSPDGSRIASGGLDGRLILWNSDGSGRRDVINGTNPIVRLAFSPDGSNLAVVFRVEIDSVRTYEFGIVSLASGELVKRFPTQMTAISALSYTPDGTAILTGDIEGRILAWSSSPYPADATEEEHPIQSFQQHSNGINSIEFSADGQRFLSASVDDTIGVWDYPSATMIRRLVNHTDDVAGAVWLSETRVFSAGRDRNMIIWDLQTGSPEQIMTAHSSLPTALALSSDARRAVTGDFQGNLVLWDTAADTLTHRMATSDIPIRAVAHHPTLPQAVAATNTGDLIFWDLTTRQPLTTITEAHDSIINDVEYTPDGRYAISAASDCVLRQWDTEDYSLVRTLGAGCLQEGEILGHERLIWDFAITADGTRALSAGDDGDVVLWDLTTGESLQRFVDLNNGKRILAIAFANDGLTAFATSDTLLFQFNLETGEIIRRFVGHAESIVSIAVSPDNQHIAASDVKRTIIIWDINTGQTSLSLIGHRGPVWSIDYDSTGGRLVSSSDDGSVYIWDLQSGDILQRYEGFDAFVRSVEFSPDDTSIIFGERALTQEDLLPLNELLNWAEQNRIYRSLSCAELRSYTPFLNEALCTPQSFSLELGENRGEIYFDSEQHWEFSGTAGEKINLIVRGDYTPGGFLPEIPLTRNRRLDTILSVYLPDGTLLAFNDDNSASAFYVNSALVNLELPVDGVYRAEIGSYGGLTRGSYTLTFARVPEQ